MSDVNHPKHYQGKIEVIEFLEDQFMNRPHEWNAVKYLARAGRKDPSKEIEDLEKSIWYIERKIELLKAKKEGKSPLRPNDMNPSSTSAISVSNLNPLVEKADTAKSVTKGFTLNNEVCASCDKTYENHHFSMLNIGYCNLKSMDGLAFKSSNSFRKA